MNTVDKQKLIRHAFVDELQKQGGVASKIVKGIYETGKKLFTKAKDPKVQEAVKKKIKEHKDDLAVVGTGAAGYGVYKGLSNKKEKKTQKVDSNKDVINDAIKNMEHNKVKVNQDSLNNANKIKIQNQIKQDSLANVAKQDSIKNAIKKQKQQQADKDSVNAVIDSWDWEF